MFAACEFKNEAGPTGIVHFMQEPGWAMKVKGELYDLTANTDYVIRITEYGDI